MAVEQSVYMSLCFIWGQVNPQTWSLIRKVNIASWAISQLESYKEIESYPWGHESAQESAQKSYKDIECNYLSVLNVSYE